MRRQIMELIEKNSICVMLLLRPIKNKFSLCVEHNIENARS